MESGGVRYLEARLTPRSGKTGRLERKLYQRLTEDIGHPKLREHLGSVVMAAKLSTGWEDFMKTMDKHLPKTPRFRSLVNR